MRVIVALTLLCATAIAEPAAKPTIEVITLDAQPALARTIRATPDALATAIGGAVLSLIATADQHTLAVVGPPFARYLSRGAQLEVEVGLPVRSASKKAPSKGVRAIELPAGSAATLVFRGRHEDLWRAHAMLDAWLAQNKRKAAGARWEVYVTNPLTTRDPALHETRIIAPLAEIHGGK